MTAAMTRSAREPEFPGDPPDLAYRSTRERSLVRAQPRPCY
jgi:hypothetical protein